jgi:hypothetical protein
VGEGLAGLALGREGQEDRPDRVVQPRVGDHHVEDRLRRRGDPVPDAEGPEHAPRRGRDRVGPPVAARVAPQGRIGHHDLERIAGGARQGKRQGQAGEPAAGDHDAMDGGGSRGHIPPSGRSGRRSSLTCGRPFRMDERPPDRTRHRRCPAQSTIS